MWSIKMSSRLFTKTYESFLGKVAMGVIGVRKALEILKNQGHEPLPIEKGTMSFKVWTSLRTKRFRVPDLLCLKCGKRFEVRSKTKPEISMSHSTGDPDRAWDYGLNDEDYVIFVVCMKHDSDPIDWKAVEPVHFASVGDMRRAYADKRAILSTSKGREEGFEKRLLWPTKFASKSGRVVNIDQSSIEVLINGKRRRASLLIKSKGRMTTKLMPLVKKGEEFVKGQAIASVINITKRVSCDRTVGADYYIDLLSSSASRVDRFVAAKALRYFHFPSVLEALRKKLQDVREEKLVLYEVAASLLEINDVAGRNYIDDIISERDPHQIHEVVISLCDISPDKSFPVIKNVLENADLSKSVRATAAWALGELGLQEAFDVLVNTFNSLDTEIKREAARALFQIYRKHRRPLSNEILKEFKTTDSKRREGLSWVIGKMLRDELESYFQDVLNLVVDEDSKIWTSYILGVQDPINFADKRELIRMKDEKLFFAVNVLWVILRSWIWGLEEY
jgi:hypothetical protein